jgi:hypothetical protein
MPLRGAGAGGPGSIVGVLALSSSIPEAFGDAALTTLRLLESSAGLVVDNGRLREHTLHAAAAGLLPRPHGAPAGAH